MKSNNLDIERKKIVKFDSQTAKVLPISTDRKRTKGWEVERTINNLKIKIKAYESLNAYDLISLFQMLDDYQHNKEKWIFQGTIKLEDETERILMKREFLLKDLCNEREISSNKNNRATIAKSFERWYRAELLYYYDDEEPINTRYIFEFKIDKDINKLIIVANANFLDFCLKSGMAMNWGRLLKYGKNYYGLQLDIYLQFNAIKIGKKNKKYAYPNVIREETLFLHTGIENEVKKLKHKREKLKQAFKKFKEITGIDYIYDKKERKWIKKSYLEKIKRENKQA